MARRVVRVEGYHVYHVRGGPRLTASSANSKPKVSMRRFDRPTFTRMADCVPMNDEV